MTRWREDITTRRLGHLHATSAISTPEVWSAAYQPTCLEPDEYEVDLRARPRRLPAPRREIEIRTEIVVSPEDDAELRRVSVTNHSRRTAQPRADELRRGRARAGDADLAHPAFSNLFVETQRRARARRAHLCTAPAAAGDRSAVPGPRAQRPRAIGGDDASTRPIAHASSAAAERLHVPARSDRHGAAVEHDRARCSIRSSACASRIRLPPGGTARVSFTTGFADTRKRRAARSRSITTAGRRARACARGTHSQVELRHLGLTIEDTMRFQRLAGRLLYGDPGCVGEDAVWPTARPDGAVEVRHLRRPADPARATDGCRCIAAGPRAAQGARVSAREGLHVRSRRPERARRELPQDLQDALAQIVESGPEQAWIDGRAASSCGAADLMTAEESLLLRAAARAVMDGVDGELPSSSDVGTPSRCRWPGADLPRRTAGGAAAVDRAWSAPVAAAGLADVQRPRRLRRPDGREYVIVIQAPRRSRPRRGRTSSRTATFGFARDGSRRRLHLVAQQPRQPADAVAQRSGQRSARRSGLHPRRGDAAASGRPRRCRRAAPRRTRRHGQGYTAFEHARDGWRRRCACSSPPTEPVKLFHLALREPTRRAPRAAQ